MAKICVFCKRGEYIRTKLFIRCNRCNRDAAVRHKGKWHTVHYARKGKYKRLFVNRLTPVKPKS